MAQSMSFPPDDKPDKGGQFATVVGTIVAVVVVLVVIGALFGGDDEPAESKSSSAASDGKALDEPETPQQRLDQALKKAGVAQPKWMRSGGKVSVEFRIADNLTRGTIRTGLASDTFSIAEQVTKAGVPFRQLEVRGTFPMTDKYGAESRDRVYDIKFSRATLDQIRYDNPVITQYDNLDDLAEGGMFYLHPEFRK